jgi:preprotein translocase subunit YajC
MEIALIYFAVLAVAFFLLIVRPQRRRAQAHRLFVAALEVGDEVMTTGGILGTVRSLDDDLVELEIAPGTVIRVARMAITQPVGADVPEVPEVPDVPDAPDVPNAGDEER